MLTQSPRASRTENTIEPTSKVSGTSKVIIGSTADSAPNRKATACSKNEPTNAANAISHTGERSNASSSRGPNDCSG
jgi:hypothetical protein